MAIKVNVTPVGFSIYTDLWSLYMYFWVRLWSSKPDTSLMVSTVKLQIPVLSEKYRRFEWKWREMFMQDEYRWRVGKWKGLCPGCDFLSSDRTETQWLHVLFICCICQSARVFERLVFPMHCWTKECWALCVPCCSVWYLGYQRHQTCGFIVDKLNVLYVLDPAVTDGDFKCTINTCKSLNAQQISDVLCNLPQHLFYYFRWFLQF